MTATVTNQSHSSRLPRAARGTSQQRPGHASLFPQLAAIFLDNALLIMKQNTTHGTQVGFPSKPESQETKHQGDEAWAVEDREIESSPAWPPTEWLDPRLRLAPTPYPPPPWGRFQFTQPSGSLLRVQKKRVKTPATHRSSCHTQGVRWARGSLHCSSRTSSSPPGPRSGPLLL